MRRPGARRGGRSGQAPKVSSGRRRIVMFSATVIRSKRPRVLRSSVTMAIPARDRLVRVREPDRPALEPDRARRRSRAGAEDRFEQLGPAGAEKPRDADDLAGPDREGDVAAGWAGRCPAALGSDRPSTSSDRPLADRVLARSPARRSRGRPSSARPASGEVSARGAVATNWPSRSTVTRSASVKTSFILWLMYSTVVPALPQVGDHAEEPRDLGVRQRRGRLVHDHDRGVERQRLGDLDHLLVADPQVADPGPRRDRPRPGGRTAVASGLHRAVVEPAEPAAAVFSRPRKMLSATVSCGNQVQLLVDDPDAGVLGLARSREPDRPAVETDLAFVLGDRAGQDLHERALARAVLAAEGVDLAGAGAISDTSRSARTPPKLLEMCRISSRAGVALPGRHRSQRGSGPGSWLG